MGLPLEAAEAPAEPSPSAAASEVVLESVSGQVELSSRISPVDACSRAQGQRPAGAVVTDMGYERLSEPGEPRLFHCRVSWSTAADAQPTRRPILFGALPVDGIEP
ncbi:MAG: hypothetical protein EA413_10315 [Cyanobium sp. PLM2.Bin73]|nr:MAG: hypothetical protein EA413_10315 [Cyanobium sp. PLM2.Bin73]